MGRIIDEERIRDQHLQIAAAAAARQVLGGDPAIDAGIEVEGQKVGMSAGEARA